MLKVGPVVLTNKQWASAVKKNQIDWNEQGKPIMAGQPVVVRDPWVVRVAFKIAEKMG